MTVKRTYWIKFPRNFANEYIIGIATSRTARGDYEEEGYERISRERALRELTYRGDAATQAYVGASIDGRETSIWRAARGLKTGVCGERI